MIRRRPIPRRCVICPKCFCTFRQREFAQKWCSWKCYTAAKRIDAEKSCEQCGKVFTASTRWHLKRRRFCGRHCMWAWRREHASELKIRFGQRKQDRGRDWPQASQLARESHEHKCQAPGCDVPLNERASVDHIIPYRLLLKLKADDPGLNPNDQRNLIPLCRPHHVRKNEAENRLFRGDVVGFISSAGRFIPKERIESALALYRLTNPRLDVAALALKDDPALAPRKRPSVPLLKARGELHWRSFLTADQVRAIRRKRQAGESRRSVAKEFGISIHYVSSITGRKKWAWLDQGAGEIEATAAS